jgi:uncharacterized delta-60 repeat protein
MRSSRRTRLGAIAIAVLAATSTTAATAAPGALDRSFSRDGKTTLEFGGGAQISDVAIANGRIMAVGFVVRSEGDETSGDELDIAMARFHRDGGLDRSFGNRGRVTTNSGNLAASSVAIQANGRIVVTSLYGRNFVVVRFLRNGEIDRSFGRRGRVKTNLGGNDDADVVAIQRDGRIVVAGTSDSSFAAARYRPNGRLDRSFNEDGTVTTKLAEGSVNEVDMALQAGGTIVVAGDVGDDFVVARYRANGMLDPDFAGDGTQTADFGAQFEFADAVAADRERIVVVGQRRGPGRDIALAAFRDDGSLDGEFSDDGLQTTAFSDNATDSAGAVEIQGDGKVALVGYTARPGEPTAVALARYQHSGTLDPTFAGNGLKTVRFGKGRRANGIGTALAVDGRGRLIAGGLRGRYTNGDFALARVLP